MNEKYKLKISISFYKTKTVKQYITRSLVWEEKDDAIACKKLMEKATTNKNIDIEFVIFTEEVSL